MAVFSFRAGILPVVLVDRKITPPSVHLHTLRGYLGDVEPSLWIALSRAERADLTDYPRRSEIWRALPKAARDPFLASTATSWIERFRLAPEQDPVPEEELLAAVLSDPRLLTVEATDPSRGLRAAVAAFERFPGWREWDVLQWLRGVAPLLFGMPQAEALRFGQIVAKRRWRSVAEELFLRRKIAALQPAIGECSDLLVMIDCLVAKWENPGLGRSMAVDWHGALFDFVVQHYPAGPEQNSIWKRAGGDLSRLHGSSAYERWQHAIYLLRSGGAGWRITQRGLLLEMLREFPHNNQLKALNDSLS